MPAVVRVKRRIDEEPLPAFLLNGKRRKIEEDTASAITQKEELSTLLKFAGTIKNQDDTATTQFARLYKEEAKQLVLQKTQKPEHTTAKVRQEVRQQQQEQRFRVVNCLRTTLMDDDSCSHPETSAKCKEITIVDIEKHSAAHDKTVCETKFLTANPLTTNTATTSSGAAATAAKSAFPLNIDTGSNYVYDVYITENEHQADNVDLMDDHYLSVRGFDNLVYEDCYDNEDDSECDSEDSNEENYFANDYPDEYDDAALHSDRDDIGAYADRDESISSLRMVLQKFVLDDDDEEKDDSSSDDGESYNGFRDPYEQSIDPEEDNFCNDIDSCVNRLKARTLKIKPKMSSDDDEEDEDDRESYASSKDEEYDNYYSENDSDE